MPTILRQRIPIAARPEPLSVATGKQGLIATSPNVPTSVKSVSSLSYRSRFIVVILAALPWLYVYRTNERIAEVLYTVNSLNAEQKDVALKLQKAKASLHRVKEETELVESEKKEMLNQLHRHGSNIDVESSTYLKAEDMENKYLTRVNELEEAIMTASYRHLQIYEPQGRAKVKVTLQSGDFFVIELAPVEVAPHAASLFVRLAESKRYDGLTLVHGSNGLGDIYSVAMLAATGQFDNERFKDSKLESVVFTEHSKIYPNDKYSVGFSNRGPHFFINMGDGVKDVIDSDICFGKIIEGRQILDSLVDRSKGGFFMVGIHSIRPLRGNVTV